MGRKKKSLAVTETQPYCTPNSSVTARNLRKSDIGGVIFGCTHRTIKECYSEKLFGLPAPHFAYIRNIDPGLTLFLFNYSDKKLHGIFEATSQGQMNINPYAWTVGGSEPTQYAAQVRIQIRRQCQPLLEDQFKPLILNNYYEEKHFWFELDRAQTRRLVELFSSSTATGSTSLSRNLTDRNTLLKPALKPEHTQSNLYNREWESSSWDAPYSAGGSHLSVAGTTMNPNIESKYDQEQEVMHWNPNIEHSYCSVVKNTSTSVPQKKWSSLFKTTLISDARKYDEEVEKLISEVNFSHLDESYTENEPSGVLSHLEENNPRWGASWDWEDDVSENNDEVPTCEFPCSTVMTELGASSKAMSYSDVMKECEDFKTGDSEANLEENNPLWGASWDWEDNVLENNDEEPSWEIPCSTVMTEVGASAKALSSYDIMKECEDFKMGDSEANHLHMGESESASASESNVELGPSCFAPCLDGESKDLKASLEEDTTEIRNVELGEPESNVELGPSCFAPCLDGENKDLEASLEEDIAEIHHDSVRECSDSDVTREINTDVSNGEDSEVVGTEDSCSSGAHVSEMKSSCLESVVSKLMHKMEDLKASQLKQFRKVSSLEQELVISKNEIERLKDRCKMLESRSFPPIAYAEEPALELHNEPYSILSDSVLIVGGFDGSSWLSALDSYSPSHDLMRSLCPMRFLRSFASVAKLNGELYIMGGVDCRNNERYNTVEAYNPSSNQWAGCPSLTKKRGNLAGASLKDKIFAIGGGDSNGCFSDVEMFDPDIGRWISSRSMLHKRFAPAAAEINGMIYVAGGYDGNEYLKSVEGFDPREHSWTRLESMNSRRGCHSLVVLNENLYALGGFDGSRTVPSVEVYDPRAASWRMVESMNDSRWYFGAAAIGESLYVIGGVKGNDEILDTVECYKEGCGWQVTNSKSFGRRGLFSAIV